MRKLAVLHIGLPKAGSTSIQQALGQNRQSLRRQNSEYFLGLMGEGYNHGEIYLSVLRSGVCTFAHHRQEPLLSTDLSTENKLRILNFFHRSKAQKHFFSSEGLSFLRTDDELQKLKTMFPNDVKFKIIFVERERQEWLESWKRQIISKPGRTLSTDPNSTMYVEPDTWLTDFEQLKQVWSAHFDDFVCIPYRKEGLMEEICDEIGIKLPPSALTTRYKERGQARQAPSRVERARQKVRRLANRADYWMRYDRHL